MNKSFDFYENGVSACKPNTPMRNMLEKAKEHTIIGIHNHPKSGAPSIADIVVARECKYKYGVVLCHNGRIYKYSVSDEFIDEWQGEFYLAKLERAVYNNKEKDINDAIASLSRIGIEMEVR